MAIRHVLPSAVRYGLREQYNQARRRGLAVWTRRNVALTDAWIRARSRRHRYTDLREDQLLAARKSDTVFIFGSGYSLNELDASDWHHFTQHDVFGFNNFVYETWIPIDFHLLRGGVESADLIWRPYAEEFTGILNANPHCANTIFLVQSEYLADFCNRLIGYGYLREGSKIFRYRTQREPGLPTASFREGLKHVGGTLADTVNAAVLIGWRHIVLVGVDLYDSRYFWLGPDETLAPTDDGRLVAAPMNLRGHEPHEMHNTARNRIVDIMSAWRIWLEKERGVAMSVYNPRSLMAEVMPVYRRAAS